MAGCSGCQQRAEVAAGWLRRLAERLETDKTRTLAVVLVVAGVGALLCAGAGYRIGVR